MTYVETAQTTQSQQSPKGRLEFNIDTDITTASQTLTLNVDGTTLAFGDRILAELPVSLGEAVAA